MGAFQRSELKIILGAKPEHTIGLPASPIEGSGWLLAQAVVRGTHCDRVMLPLLLILKSDSRASSGAPLLFALFLCQRGI